MGWRDSHFVKVKFDWRYDPYVTLMSFLWRDLGEFSVLRRPTAALFRNGDGQPGGERRQMPQP
jgi:hypothetical protein